MPDDGSRGATDVATLRAAALAVHRLAVDAHARFERDVWQVSPAARVPTRNGSRAVSYHNEEHVRAVAACAEAVFAAGPAGTDPFRIAHDLRRWNDGTGAALGWEELGWVAHLAFSCHDLGNITATDRVAEGPDGPELDLRDAYDSSVLYPAPAVEVRSAKIALALLRGLLEDRALEKRVAPLVRHLVLQTVFHFEQTSSPEPFWLPMQTIDMIGSYFFSAASRVEALAGLFAEMRVQKPGRIPVAPFLASLGQRFARLLPDEAEREAVPELFERNPAGRTREEVFGVPERFARFTEPVPYEDAIALLLEAG